MFTGRTLSRLFRRNTKKQNRIRPLSRSPRARLLLQPLEDRRVPATITVTGNSDAIGVDLVCSLREAIDAINNGGVGANSDVVANTTGTYGINDSITFSGDFTVSVSGHMIVSKSVVITGTGETKTVLQNVKAEGVDSRIFNTSAAGTATITLESMTLKNGLVSASNNGGAILNVDENLTLNTVTFDNNKTKGAGGAIATSGGTLTLTGSTIKGSSAGTTGGGIHIAGASTLSISGTTFTKITSTGAGGGIHAAASASITISSSTITANTSTGAGTGINLAAASTVNLTSSSFSLNSSGGAAGGIHSITAASSITIDSCTFSANTGTTGGALAVPLSGPSTTFDIKNSTFNNNRATSSGGGVIYAGASMTIKMSNDTFTANSTSTTGGGVLYNGGGTHTVTVDSCSFDGNFGNAGGGFYISTGTVTLDFQNSTFTNNKAMTGVGGLVRGNGTTKILVENSSFSGNSAATSAGVLYFSSASSGTITASTFSKNTGTTNGGAIMAAGTASVTVNNSTFSDNTANGNTSTTGGGAIYFSSNGVLTVNNSTLVYNTATGVSIGGGIRRATTTGFTTMISSIVAGNSAGTGPDINVTGGSVTIGGGANLVGVADVGGFTLDTTSGSNFTGTLATPLDPLLNALALNGGTTLNHLPTNLSPAVTKGNQNGLTVDQRGTARPPVGPDIGSVQGVYLIPLASATPPPTVTVAGGTNYSVVVLYTDETGVDTTTIDVNDIQVSGKGYISPASPASFSQSGPATSVSVTYNFGAAPLPAGPWDVGDNGVYSVTLNAAQVFDTDGPNAANPGQLGTFKVAIPDTFTVNSTSDIDDFLDNGVMTLREAIRLANANSGATDTIILDSTVFTGTPVLIGSTMSITDNVVINGPTDNTKAVFDGQSTFQIFNIGGGATSVSMSGMTLTNGSAANGSAIQMTSQTVTLDNMVFSSGSATTSGGAIALTTGNLTVSDSTFNGNTATTNGGSIFGSSTCTITILDCLFDGNTAGGNGGAIYLTAGTLFVDPSLFRENEADNGGAIYASLTASTVTIDQTQFTTNTATTLRGGAINLVGAGQLIITNSTFDSNRSTTTGGAIALSTGSATITNTTISRNEGTDGAGVHVSSSTAGQQLKVFNTTVAQNTASAASSAGGLRTSSTVTTTTLSSTIIASNVGNSLPSDIVTTAATSIGGDNNLIGVQDATWTATGTGNLIGDATIPIDPLLNAPADNGGFVLPDASKILTMSLKAGSQAYNAGNNLNGAGPFDQRGNVNRTIDGLTDIGAFEAPVSPIPVAKLFSAPTINSATTVPYSFQVRYTDDSGFDTTTFGSGDIEVTGSGYASPQGATTTAINGGGNDFTVTYEVAAPTGGWGDWNIGSYAVTIKGSQVSDDSANFVPGPAVLGSFKTAFATSLKVDFGTDEDDGNYAAGDRSLREAIKVASGNSGFHDTVTFDATLNNTTISLTLGQMTISDDVTVKGNVGGNIKISADLTATTTNRIFNISIPAVAATVSISDLELNAGLLSSGNGGAILSADEALTFTNVKFTDNRTNSGSGGAISISTLGGTLTLTGCEFTGNSATSAGGAIQLAAATTVTLTSTSFTNNSSGSTGGAINNGTGASSITADSCTFTGNFGTSGGAVAVNVTSTTFDAKNSTFTDNRASTNGGAIYTVVAATVTLTNDQFINNTATSAGGAIRFSTTNTPSITIDSTTFSGNTTGSTGGGIYFGHTSGTVNISNSTFAKNTANTNGGGIQLNSSTPIVINNSTFSGNTANSSSTTGGGGAINVVSANTMTINNSTIVDNSAPTGAGGGIRRPSGGSMTMISTILAGNSATLSADMHLTGATTIAGGANLVGVADVGNFTLDTTAGANFTGTAATPLDPQVNPLGPNGGPTETHSLKNGSPARDVGNQNGLAFDQRGVARPLLDADIGSFEAPLGPTPTVNAQANNVSVSGGTTFDVTVTFKDDVGVQVGTIDLADIVVKSNIGGTTLTAKSFVTSPGSGTVTPVTATYTFDAPDNGVTDTWDATDTDQYSVWIVGTVSDDNNPDNDVVSPAKIGSFTAFIGGRSLVVDTLGDIDDGDYSAGKLTIREANNFSNANAGKTDTITFGAPLTSASVLLLSLGQLTVTDSVNINATSLGGITISGNNLSRVFNINDNVVGPISVSMADLTITGGKVTGDGAGINIQDESVTLTRVSVSGNSASVDGGGINTEATGATLSLDLSTISLNTAGSDDGGGINMEIGATFTMKRTSVAFNIAADDGGGIYTGKAAGTHSILIENSTIQSNTANATVGGGGGINFGGSMSSLNIRNSTISGNRTTKDGGGIQFYYSVNPALIQNTTIANNTALGNGGGINRHTDNTGTLTLESTIISNNTGTGGDIQATSGAVSVERCAIGAFSVTGTGTFTDVGGNSIFAQNLKLAVLASNGGPTQTHRPASDSPVKDIGFNPSPTVTYDQRGGDDTGPLTDYPREIGVSVDIGAFEIDPNVPSATPTLPNVIAATTVPYTFTVQYVDDVSMDNVTIKTGVDYTVTGPSFGPATISFDSIDFDGPGPVRTATYSFTPPVNGAAGWDYTDNGVYFITLAKDAVKDMGGTSVPDGVIGFFVVQIPVVAEVSTLIDESDGDYSDGDLSLREAILLSNAATATVNIINFKASMFTGGPQTSTITLGDMAITNPVTINGPTGANGLTLDGTTNLTKRAFSIDLATAGGAVSISSMTLNGFTVTGNGGAIDNQDSVLSLTGMVLSNNTASSGGGGVNLALSTAKINVTNSVFSANTAVVANGGAINGASTSTMNINNSSFRDNVAQGTGSDGGAFYINGGSTVTINNSTMSGNRAGNTGSAQGGGVMYLNASTTVTITNSTLSNNTSAGSGGAIHSDDPGTLVIRNTTIAGNSAGQLGGGINLRLTGNTVNLFSSIVANNAATGTGPDINGATAGTVVNVENSNISNSTNITTLNQTGINQIDVDPLLDPLGNYGGFTLPDGTTIETQRLKANSPVINGGGNTIPLNFDQRDSAAFPRSSPVVGKTDMGAFELRVPQVSSVVLSDASALPITHRSLIKTIVVTFSTPVNFSGPVANAFTLFRSLASVSIGPNANVGLVATPSVSPPGGTTAVTLTFTGALTEFDSLIDGIYDFTIDDAQVTSNDGATLDGDANNLPGTDYAIIGSVANGWFRYFGDFANDQSPPTPPPLGQADGALTQYVDFIEFRNAFTSPSLIFDWDNDGTVDQDDFIKFRNNFGGAP